MTSSAMVSHIRRAWSQWNRTIANPAQRTGTEEVASRLTVLLLALYSGHYWDVRIPATILAGIALMWPQILSAASFWCVLGAAMLIGLAPRYHVLDNHKFLMLYWILTLGLCCLYPTYLRTNARILLALCFSFSVYWKATTLNFIDGSFMQYQMLTDDRFRAVSEFVCGNPAASGRTTNGRDHYSTLGSATLWS
jgi:hypothetical protein